MASEKTLEENIHKFYLNSQIFMFPGKDELYTPNPALGDELKAKLEGFNLYSFDKRKYPTDNEGLVDFLYAGLNDTDIHANEHLFEALEYFDRADFVFSKNNPYSPLLRAATKNKKDAPKAQAMTLNFLLAHLTLDNYTQANIGIIGSEEGYLASVVAKANPGKTIAFNVLPEFESSGAENMIAKYDEGIDRYEILRKDNLEEIKGKYDGFFDVLLFNQGIDRKNIADFNELFHDKQTISSTLTDTGNILKPLPNVGVLIAPVTSKKECDAYLTIPTESQGKQPLIKPGLCQSYIEQGKCLFDGLDHERKSYDFIISHDRGLFQQVFFPDVEVRRFRLY